MIVVEHSNSNAAKVKICSHYRVRECPGHAITTTTFTAIFYYFIYRQPWQALSNKPENIVCLAKLARIIDLGWVGLIWLVFGLFRLAC
jgi:hypothetical protein